MYCLQQKACHTPADNLFYVQFCTHFVHEQGDWSPEYDATGHCWCQSVITDCSGAFLEVVSLLSFHQVIIKKSTKGGFPSGAILKNSSVVTLFLLKIQEREIKFSSKFTKLPTWVSTRHAKQYG